MIATLILKVLLTACLVIANLFWIWIIFMANIMNPQGEWDHSTWIYMLIPTAINGLILWSMWE